MACKTETFVADGVEYSVTQWPAEKAMLMQLKIMKVIGPVFATLAAEQDDVGDTIAAAINSLFSSSSPDEILSIIKESIIGNVAADGRRINAADFTERFSGDSLLNVYLVFAFVVRVNYSAFIRGQLAADMLTKLKA